ncbi:LrgB family protein [Gynuella sp.]|uniref:LrgB family protein n=1 Tax=Gynuella sp. TaxID=2969146 RepID=UPI003D134DFF
MTSSIQMLLALCITIGTYLLAEQIYRKFHRSALVHPVIVTIFTIMGLLKLLGWEYPQYRQDTTMIHFMLGPATVALAIPLYENISLIRKMLIPLMVATLVGAFIASSSAFLLSEWLINTDVLSRSMLVKSITTPIAIGVAEKVGGSGSLAAGLVLLTGAIGCLVLPGYLRLLKLQSEPAEGFIMGMTAHGFGTAQAFEKSVTCGAFAGLAMSLTGVVTAILIPLFVPVISLF